MDPGQEGSAKKRVGLGSRGTFVETLDPLFQKGSDSPPPTLFELHLVEPKSDLGWHQPGREDKDDKAVCLALWGGGWGSGGQV